MSHLRDVVEILARALADDPQRVVVTEVEHRGTILIEVSAAPPDVGRSSAAGPDDSRPCARWSRRRSVANGRWGWRSGIRQPAEIMTAWDEMVVVGCVARAHGNRGHVVVNPETDFPGERFRVGSTVYVRRQGRVEPLVMTAVRFQRGPPDRRVGRRRHDERGGRARERRAARAAGGAARAAGRIVLPARTGRVHRPHDGRLEIGRVTGVDGPVWGSRLVVDSGRGEVLVPMAREICVGVDLAARTNRDRGAGGIARPERGGNRRADRGL